MLKEYRRVKQIKGEAKRRWFSNEFFDLIVWFDDKRNIVGFQLCYDVLKASRALTWRQGAGYAHNRIDEGEDRPGKMKASPILVADGIFESVTIAETFKKESQLIEKDISTFVYNKIMEYPG